MRHNTKNAHTFSLTISPVSLAWALESPLACLLHSTRGSWRNVLSTLKREKNRILLFCTCTLRLWNTVLQDYSIIIMYLYLCTSWVALSGLSLVSEWLHRPVWRDPLCPWAPWHGPYSGSDGREPPQVHQTFPPSGEGEKGVLEKVL